MCCVLAFLPSSRSGAFLCKQLLLHSHHFTSHSTFLSIDSDVNALIRFTWPSYMSLYSHIHCKYNRTQLLLFLLFLNVSETHQSSSCNVRIVFKHRRELREWAWHHSVMFAEKTQYMFLMLCARWIKRRWFWWARKNHYSTQNYKIQGCKILFITNSIWRRSRWGWGWEVPDKKVETFFFGELHFLIEIYSRILAFPVTKKWYKCQRWDLSQRKIKISVCIDTKNLNFSLYLYLNLYFYFDL